MNTRRAFLLIACFGPAIGVTFGLINTASATLFWIGFGQPDFYFRGWQGVWISFLVDAARGAFYGLVYGVYLACFERFTARKVPLAPLATFLLAFAASLLSTLNYLSFRQRSVAWLFFWPELLIFLVALIRPLRTGIRTRPLAHESSCTSGDHPC